MSWTRMAAVIELPPQNSTDPVSLTSSERWVLFLLAYHFNDHRGFAWPKIGQLASEAGFTTRGIRGILQRLVAKGYIIITPRVAKSNVYELFIPPLERPEPEPGEERRSPPSEEAASRSPGEERHAGGEERLSQRTEEDQDRTASFNPLKRPKWARPGVEVKVFDERFAGGYSVGRLIERDDGQLALQAAPGCRIPEKLIRWPRIRPLHPEAAAQGEEGEQPDGHDA